MIGKNYKIYFLLFAGLFLISIGFMLNYNKNIESDFTHITKTFQNDIFFRENLLENKVNSLVSNYCSEDKIDSLFMNAESFNKLFKNEGIIILINQGDKIKFWSDNSVQLVNSSLVKSKKLNGLIHLKSGWFEYFKKPFNDSTSVIGLFLIKNDYKYQNQYLDNSFAGYFNMPPDTKIITEKGKYNVYSKYNNYLFSLDFKKYSSGNNLNIYLDLFTLVLGIILIFYSLYKLFDNLARKYKKQIFNYIFILIIILIRCSTILFNFPDVLFSLTLFKHINSDNFLFPSIGDLLINTILIFYIIIYLYKNLDFRVKNQYLKYVTSFAVLVTVFVFYDYSFNIIKNLLIKSNITFNVFYFAEIALQALTGFIIIILVLFSFFLFSKLLCERTVKIIGPVNSYIVVILSVLVYTLIKFFFYKVDIISMIILLLVLFMHIYFKISVSKVGTFLYIVFYIFIFAVLSTYIFYVSNESKENKNVRLIAEKLANEQDPLAEFLFHDIEENMKYDEVLEEYYKNIPLFEKNIVKRLQQKYFKSFLSKYDVQFTFCKENDTIKFKPVNAQRIKKINKPHIVKNQLVRKICDVYFEEQIKKYGRPTMSSNLYFLNNGGDISYLAKIPITTDEDSPETIMYIELEAKGMVRELGYPELLIDKDVNLNPDLSNYSYARYRNNVLINTFGNYIYSNNGINYNKSPEKVIFFNMGGYNHMYYKVDKTDFLIISKKQLGFVDIISPFTYLFVIFLIFTLLLQVFAKIPLKLFLIEYNFRTKIQSSMIIIVLISLLMIGSTTIYYIIKLNNSKNSDSIEEKTHSVLTEIENKFSASENLNTYTYDNLNDILINFSNIFFTDINIYNTNGDLIGSSREKIFDEGLIGKRMNLTAYKKMFFEQQPYFVHDEYIGKLGYSSAYVPFRNNQNKTIAFLNIPYFTQQSELKREISVYLVTIINIYLLLTLIAVFVAIFISGRVAKPLSLIAEKLSQIKLGKKNELIKWSYNDEIGVLVKEYNRLTEELVRSADLLAKSERESAWREMARQVAHEIKNPLTPMKLGIQYIQKASNEDDPLLKERIEKFTKTMISQIDSLSSIASAFSDFANMPKSINELIELNNFINSVIDLHKDNESFDLTYSSDINSSCMIYADKKQLLRVFNNLINNSIQAFKDYVRGNIQIKLYSDDKFYYISFKDNGCGIDDSFKSKIFSPNFTTKNGGMGLGLAMCKSIINSFEGDISFVSTKDIGTTFFIKLPKISE